MNLKKRNQIPGPFKKWNKTELIYHYFPFFFHFFPHSFKRLKNISGFGLEKSIQFQKVT